MGSKDWRLYDVESHSEREDEFCRLLKERYCREEGDVIFRSSSLFFSFPTEITVVVI